jgi:hypothetical protein
LSITTEEFLANLILPITVYFTGNNGAEVELSTVWNISLGNAGEETYNVFANPQVLYWYPTSSNFDVE